MNTLIQHIEEDENFTLTENSALTHKSTLSNTLDFFGLGAAMRSRSDTDIVALFRKAFGEDRTVAVKTLFYIRDCRGGAGERRTFKILLKWLGENYPKIVLENLENIVFFGRYDDLYSLENTKTWNYVLEYIATEWNKGFEKNSLIFKWLPSPNTSSKETCRLAKIVYKYLGLSEKEYRQTLSQKRKEIGIVEQKMCANDWTEIDYETVPSKASLNYKDAFAKRDGSRYAQYIEDVKSGKKTIKASVLYPYEIVEKLLGYGSTSETLDVLWDALPDYMDGNAHNGIVVADVSGSMSGRPMAVSISLAMYFAERNNGQFKNKFITFSAKPELQSVVGNNIREKVQNLSRANWDMNTDLQAVFDLILRTAVRHNVPEKDMPQALYIVSDMEFDACCANNSKTNFKTIRDKYEAAGYKAPSLVFWNVDARNNQTPITKNDTGTCLVSGCSPSILKTLLSGKVISPVDVMLETINSERYDRVKI